MRLPLDKPALGPRDIALRPWTTLWRWVALTAVDPQALSGGTPRGMLSAENCLIPEALSDLRMYTDIHPPIDATYGLNTTECPPNRLCRH